MRVLKCTTWYPVVTGASGRFIVDQAAALSAAGVSVGVLFSRLEGLGGFNWSRALAGVPQVTTIRKPVPTVGFSSWCPPHGLGLADRVNLGAMEALYPRHVQLFGRPDVLHGHVGLGGGRGALALSRRTGLPFIVTEHSSEIAQSTLTPQRARLVRQVYRNAARVVCVSDYLGARVARICPDAKIVVVPNIVGASVFAARRTWAVDGGVFKVVTISWLTPIKRVADAIEALARLPGDMRQRLTYVVIGDGPELGMLKQLARHRGVQVEFRGSLSHSAAMEELASADLLLHTSQVETFGIVIAEALALGVPVVATRTGGARFVLGEHGGILVPVGDVGRLASGVYQLLSNRSRWQATSTALSFYARSRFSEAAVANALVDIYSGAISSK